jgi:hypothetical protein
MTRFVQKSGDGVGVMIDAVSIQTVRAASWPMNLKPVNVPPSCSKSKKPDFVRV